MSKFNNELLKRFVCGLMLLIFLGIFLKNAWISEDAYINFRSVEQFWAGNGPRWNPQERVQVYTSPAWFWLCALTAPVFEDPFMQTLTISFICLLMLILINVKLFSSCRVLGAVFLASVVSRAFFDFSTSGLENSMCYCVIAGFVFHYLKTFLPHTDEKMLFRAMLFAGITVVCRHDLILLVAPPVFWLLFIHRKSLSVKSVILLLIPAVLPVFLWTLFSVCYYGFPFPNTAYAKLFTGIPRLELIRQGFIYLKINMFQDSVTLLIIILAAISGWIRLNRKMAALSTSLALYILYLIWIGGDFMLGRFLAAPFVMSILMMGVIFESLLKQRKTMIILTGIWLLYTLASPNVPIRTPWDYKNETIMQGIADERGFYFESSSLVAYFQRRNIPWFPLHQGCQAGYEFARVAQPIMATKHIGFFGYWTGVNKPIVDTLALADPLLARRPVTDKEPWRPGHFVRDIPAGYIESILTGENRITDDNVHDMYEDIRIITQGPLWSAARWMAILRGVRKQF